MERNVVPVTVTLEPEDVDLLDRLATLAGSNRSLELRSLLSQLRPMIRQTVEALEGADRARGALNEAAARATVEEFAAILPRVERIQAEYLGAMAALEGEAAAAASDRERAALREAGEPPDGNTGVTPPRNQGQEPPS